MEDKKYNYFLLSDKIFFIAVDDKQQIEYWWNFIRQNGIVSNIPDSVTIKGYETKFDKKNRNFKINKNKFTTIKMKDLFCHKRDGLKENNENVYTLI